MLKKMLVMTALGVCGTVAVMAQEQATLVLINGQRISGELVDMNGSGFAMRVNGQDQNYGMADVAVVEFAGGGVPADAQAKVSAGQPVVVLRNGQTIDGRLTDVGGTRPLRLTIDTGGGSRDYSSSDVARIYLRNPGNQAVATSGQQPQTAPALGPAQSVNVPANQAWTDTGIIVARGERIQFNSSGDIMVQEGASSGVGGSPVAPNGRLPFAGAGVGALIARIGNSQPFLIGSNSSPIPMPANGRLMLGVNDPNPQDNTGSFSVSISRLGR